MASERTERDHLSAPATPPTAPPLGPEIMIIRCFPPSPISTASLAGSDLVMATKVELDDAERPSIIAALALAMIDNPKPYTGIFTDVKKEPYWDPKGTSPERRRRRAGQEEMRWKEIMEGWKEKEEKPPNKDRPRIKGFFTTEDALANEEIDKMLGIMEPTLSIKSASKRASSLAGEGFENKLVPASLIPMSRQEPPLRPLEDGDLPSIDLEHPFHIFTAKMITKGP